MTTTIEQPAPWTFTCPICDNKVSSYSVVTCAGLAKHHESTCMERTFIKVESSISGKVRLIEVPS